MAQPSPALLDTLDMVFLGTIGLGTIAWFARRQIAEKIFGSKEQDTNEKLNGNGTAPKRERNFVKVMQEQGRKVIFFYGSQTGTAEDYASRLAKECQQKYGVNCMTADIELYDLQYLDTVPEDCLVFFIMATYGEGEPTDNAVDFWELLMEEEPQFSENEDLKNLRYVMFGLGNKTYEHYNEVARKMDQRFSKLGAQRIGERGEGDDDASLEEDFLAWQDNMWPVFCDALGVDETNTANGPRQATFSVEELEGQEDMDQVYLGEIGEKPKEGARIIYDAKRPYNAPITSRDLFQNTDRHCLHIEVDVSDSNLTYQTGDHIAIWPTNNEDEVTRLASMLGLSDKLDVPVMVKAIDSTASKKYPFPVPATYRSIFRHYLDICAPTSRQTLMSLVEYAPTEETKEVLRQLSKDKDEYRLKVGEAVRNLGEVLEFVAGNQAKPGFFNTVPFDLIVESISRLQPRYYSISSSAKESPKKIAVTAVTLTYQPDPTPERTVYGVCTNYLWQLHAAANKVEDGQKYPTYDLAGPRNALQGVKVPVHIRRSQFKLPRNPNVPVIMVGPGTGVAPFRGFVHERAAQKAEGKPVGPTLLFFGCRNSEQDYLYKEEWPGLFETLGEESRMITAFSRETDKKVYVQHRLQENGKEVWELLKKNGTIFVCGDAKNMARDVNQTFVNFAIEFGGLTEEKAHDYVKNLRNSGRYQEDVWS
ncbi:NADPH-dependent cytochrome P450 oxidoreductase [Circinella umbellata]|nr:NADPH-dependent cytochrome P450 oxidoreductase [Circinella umbellata]